MTTWNHHCVPERPRVSVVVPACNEEGTVTQVVASAGKAFEALGIAGEVVLVDDGSVDDTPRVAAEASQTFSFLRVARHRRNLGLTQALETGFRMARGEVVMLIPADMESNPEEDIPALLNRLEEGL